MRLAILILFGMGFMGYNLYVNLCRPKDNPSIWLKAFCIAVGGPFIWLVFLFFWFEDRRIMAQIAREKRLDLLDEIDRDAGSAVAIEEEK